MLDYCIQLCQTVVHSRRFRHEVLKVLVQLYQNLNELTDFISVCQCLVFLDDAQKVADILDKLLKSDLVESFCSIFFVYHSLLLFAHFLRVFQLMAYQVAFDLSENQNQSFLLRVSKALPETQKPVRFLALLLVIDVSLLKNDDASRLRRMTIATRLTWRS
jgi:26S proteasome regulatory subunit N2